jgi:DNA repair photolyase
MKQPKRVVHKKPARRLTRSASPRKLVLEQESLQRAKSEKARTIKSVTLIAISNDAEPYAPGTGIIGVVR